MTRTVRRAYNGSVRRRGVSLVEVLVSLSLIVVASVFVLSVFPRLAAAGCKSRDRGRAAVLAYNWSNVRKNKTHGQFQEEFTQSYTRVETESQSGRTRSVEYSGFVEVFSMYDDLRRVRVTVTWRDVTGAQQLVLDTIQGRPNP